MALSRLRHPAITRAPSILKARLLSHSASSIRSFSCYYGRNSQLDGIDISLWSGLLQTASQTYNGFSKIGLQYGARSFSTESPPHTVLGMPALSPTMSQGNIAKWRKKEGDKIEVGDVLCEIETDKATLEFECLEEGFMAKILVPEGSKDVPVGKPIAVVVEEAENIQNIPALFESGSEAKEEKSMHQAANLERNQHEPSLSDLPPHVVLEMPALSPTMNQGNIGKWRKREGDKIEVGDILCEIETDKATLEFESLEEGYLAKILVPEGSKDVAVGVPIALTVEDQENIEAIKTSSAGSSEVKRSKKVPQSSDSKVSEKSHTFNRMSPSAKILISEHGLDASSIKASGAFGTLLKTDVLAAIRSGTAKSSVPKVAELQSLEAQTQRPSISLPEAKSDVKDSENHEDLPNTQIRKVIARRLLESKQSMPHLYLSSDVVLDPLLAFRKELKEKHDVKVSVNDIVIKAVANALKNVPEANAYWNVEKEDAILCDTVDISIAVATDKGLMTPIIRNADQKSISAISSEVKQLAEKARAGKLAPNEFQGGTFSISNLGMYPVDQFCAITNPPQAGILAVGRGTEVVEPVMGSDGIEKPMVLTKMNLTLSADHRIFDGKVGAAFFSALQSNFHDIRRLIL